MDRAHREGQRIGRKRIEELSGHTAFENQLGEMLPGLLDGEISVSQAARDLDVSRRTVKRRMSVSRVGAKGVPNP